MILKGKTRSYELEALSVNARCRVEWLTGRAFRDVLKELAGRKRPDIRTVRAFLTALLRPDQGHVDEILKDIGGVPRIRQAAQGAWRAMRQKAS